MRHAFVAAVLCALLGLPMGAGRSVSLARADLMPRPPSHVSNKQLAGILRTAVQGPGGLKSVMAESLRVLTLERGETKEKTTAVYAKAEITRKLWDAEIAPLFTDLLGGAKPNCEADACRCRLVTRSGTEIEYAFEYDGDTALLESVHLRAPE